MKKYFIFFIILGLFTSHAMVSHIKIRGKIVKYNQQSVTLKQDNGKTIEVPKKSIPAKLGKLKTGKKVYAVIFDSKKIKTFRQAIIYKEKHKEEQKQNNKKSYRKKLRSMSSKKN